MKHFGNFVALLIVAVNALFTGLLLLVHTVLTSNRQRIRYNPVSD